MAGGETPDLTAHKTVLAEGPKPSDLSLSFSSDNIGNMLDRKASGGKLDAKEQRVHDILQALDDGVVLNRDAYEEGQNNLQDPLLAQHGKVDLSQPDKPIAPYFNAEKMKRVIKVANSSRLKARSPEVFKEFSRDAAADAPPVTMPVEKFDELLQAADKTPEEVLDHPEDYYTAKMEESPTVEIPLSDIAAMAEHVTPDVINEMGVGGTPSVAEIKAEKIGEIPEDISRAIKREAAPIRMTDGFHNSNGQGEGLAHIEAQHGAEIRDAGYSSVSNFVGEVAGGFNQIWEGRSGRLMLVKANGTSKTAVIELRPNGDGSSWIVKTAGIFRKDYPAGGDRKLLWEGARPLEDPQALSGGQSSLTASSIPPSSKNVKAHGEVPTGGTSENGKLSASEIPGESGRVQSETAANPHEVTPPASPEAPPKEVKIGGVTLAPEELTGIKDAMTDAEREASGDTPTDKISVSDKSRQEEGRRRSARPKGRARIETGSGVLRIAVVT